jgi:hypothetical protein
MAKKHQNETNSEYDQERRTQKYWYSTPTTLLLLMIEIAELATR